MRTDNVGEKPVFLFRRWRGRAQTMAVVFCRFLWQVPGDLSVHFFRHWRCILLPPLEPPGYRLYETSINCLLEEGGNLINDKISERVMLPDDIDLLINLNDVCEPEFVFPYYICINNPEQVNPCRFLSNWRLFIHFFKDI